MNTTDLVHYISADDLASPAALRPILAPSRHELAAPVRCSIVRARDFLVSEQRLDGSWAGRRTGDTHSLCQFALLYAFLGRKRTESFERVARAIVRSQRPEGGWSIAPGGPIDQDTSVLAYFALKLAGEEGSQPHMRRARQAIRERGGADPCGAETRLWLALLGQIDYGICPPAPPERLLSPMRRRAWSSAVECRLAALTVIWALRPRREVELAGGIRELFIEHPDRWPRLAAYLHLPRSTWLAGGWSRCEQFGFVPLRRRALDAAECLLAEPLSEAWANHADVQELAWRWIALAALGHAEDSRAIAACAKLLERLIVVDSDCDEARSQPETSLTVDTALAIEALVTSGVPADEPHVAAATLWTASHRLTHIGAASTWRELTAVLRVAACLRQAGELASNELPPHVRLASCRRPSLDLSTGHFAMHQLGQLSDEILSALCRAQRADGGWPAVMIADTCHRAQGIVRRSVTNQNAASEPDATGATLELLARLANPVTQSAQRRAVDYLRASQQGDGSWISAAGDQRLRATTWAICGLAAAGGVDGDPAVAAGLNWLLVSQLEPGGWCEVDESISVGKEFVVAESTAIHTAWALLALVAAGLADHDATRRAAALLIDRQCGDGAWTDDQLIERDSAASGWYRNDLASAAWPLVALARWMVAIGEYHPDVRPSTFRLVCDE